MLSLPARMIMHIIYCTAVKCSFYYKKYYAIVHNQFNNTEGVVDAPIGRNPSDRKKMAVDKRMVKGSNAL